MQVSEMFVLALISVSFIGIICILLVVFMSRSKANQAQGTQVLTPTNPSPINQNKRLTNYSVGFGAGLTAIVFASRLIPTQPNWTFSIILLVGGLATINFSYIGFLRLK